MSKIVTTRSENSVKTRQNNVVRNIIDIGSLHTFSRATDLEAVISPTPLSV